MEAEKVSVGASANLIWTLRNAMSSVIPRLKLPAEDIRYLLEDLHSSRTEEFQVEEIHSRYDRVGARYMREGGMLTLHQEELDHYQGCSGLGQCARVGQSKDQLASTFAS